MLAVALIGFHVEWNCKGTSPGSHGFQLQNYGCPVDDPFNRFWDIEQPQLQ